MSFVAPTVEERAALRYLPSEFGVPEAMRACSAFREHLEALQSVVVRYAADVDALRCVDLNRVALERYLDDGTPLSSDVSSWRMARFVERVFVVAMAHRELVVRLLQFVHTADVPDGTVRAVRGFCASLDCLDSLVDFRAAFCTLDRSRMRASFAEALETHGEGAFSFA